MTPKALWQSFIEIYPELKNETYQLIDLPFENQEVLISDILSGKKRAKSSLYCLYELNEKDLPEVDEFYMLIDDSGDAISIIQITKVTFSPFIEVSKDHINKEYIDDCSVSSWRKKKMEKFKRELHPHGISFDHDMLLVLEEFENILLSKIS